MLSAQPFVTELPRQVDGGPDIAVACAVDLLLVTISGRSHRARKRLPPFTFKWTSQGRGVRRIKAPDAVTASGTTCVNISYWPKADNVGVAPSRGFLGYTGHQHEIMRA
jgi:hypothetical protein